MSASKQTCMVTRTIYSAIIFAISSTLYAGGRSNGSPSSEARPDLDEASLILALLVLSTAGSGEIFVDRMLRDRPHGCVRPGPGPELAN